VNDIVSKNCLEIDPNMIVEQMEPMRTARFNSPLVLINNKYVGALGGMVLKNKPTE
jgi:hypothetical protein